MTMHKGHVSGMGHFGHDHDHDHTHAHTHEHTHEDGHVHTHEHTHEGDHCHSHGHDHAVSETASEPLKRAVKMLSYMYNHNTDHAAELAEMGEKLKALGETEAAAVIAEAVVAFRESNEKLHDALHHLA